MEHITHNMEHGIHNKVKNLSDMISVFPKILDYDWLKIKGIGEKSAKSLTEWFGNEENLKLLEKMRNLGVEVNLPMLRVVGYVLRDKSFVLTGELEALTRDEARKKIRALGGNVSSSVSKSTDFVVVGKNPGSKYDKARELGVKIVDEEEFKRLIG
jgi:DNA ligase (NAD+)